eukprot:COSAG05_NODE_2085_length_3597_cov_2.234420_3_plen_569_part_00
MLLVHSIAALAAAAGGLLVPTSLSVGYGRTGANLTFVSASVSTPPRFSWSFSPSSSRGLLQASYRVQVICGYTRGVVWDSETVVSNRTRFVPYGGQPLSTDARYAWRVQVTAVGQAEASAFSGWQSFATALLPADWDKLGAQWINGGNVSVLATVADTKVPPAQDRSARGRKQLRTSFDLPPAVRSAIAHASLFWAGVGYGKLWLNDEEVGDEALGPWTTWSERILYRCEDVTNRLAAGNNAIGVWLGSGQYDSSWTHSWCSARKGCSPELGLRLLLRLTLANGTKLTIARSGNDWLASPSPFVSDDVYKGIEFDARNLSDGFSAPNFRPGIDDKQQWTPAAVVWKAAPFQTAKMTPHIFTPDRVISQRFPVKLTTPSPGVYVFWFAANDVGWAQLNNVQLPAGTKLTLAHAEQMRLPNGTVCLVGCLKGRVYYAWGGAVDSYTLRGGGKPESYGAHFSYHGFQFVELTGWPAGAAAPTLKTISAQVVHSDNRRIATLSFPNTGKAAILTQINDNIVRSLLSNMHSVESDCPTRERVGWTGDSQVSGRSLSAASLDVYPCTHDHITTN